MHLVLERNWTEDSLSSTKPYQVWTVNVSPFLSNMVEVDATFEWRWRVSSQPGCEVCMAARLTKQRLVLGLLCVTLTRAGHPGTASGNSSFLQKPCSHLRCSEGNHELRKAPYCSVMSPLECSECFGDQFMHRTYTWHLTLVWLFTSFWTRNNSPKPGRAEVISASKTCKRVFISVNSCLDFCSVISKTSGQVPSTHTFRLRCFIRDIIGKKGINV